MRIFIVLQVFFGIALLPTFAQTRTERNIEGLEGYIKNVRIEEALCVEKDESGEVVELPKVIFRDVTYNFNGNCTEIVQYEKNGTVAWKYVVKYNSSGTKLEELDLEADGTLGSKRVYQYLGNGNKYTITEYSPDRSVIGWRVCVRDERRTETIKRYDADGTLIGRYVYKYDQNGRKTEELVYGQNAVPAHVPRRWTYTYDSKGNLSEESSYESIGGSRIGRRIYNHNEGNLVEEYSQKEDGTIFDKVRYSYEFDSKGNWIKRITQKETLFYGKSIFRPTIVTYRTITYF